MKTYVYKRLSRRPSTFRSLTGMTVSEFDILYKEIGPKIGECLIAILNERDRQRTLGAGGVYKNNSKNRLLMTIIWLRIYATYEVLGFLFALDKSNVQRNMKPILDVLEKEMKKEIAWPDKENRQKMRMAQFMKEFSDVVAIVDATEQPAQRPKDNEVQKKYYSGKKKQHTLKKQIIVTPEGETIHLSKTEPGSKSDKKIFDESDPGDMDDSDAFMGDKGYQGIQQDLYVILPDKKPKGKELSLEQKTRNKRISKVRLVVEHTFGEIKNYQALSQKYRHPRDSHDAVFGIVAGLVNRQIRSRIAENTLGDFV
jgi:hypothetical protein